MFEFVCLCALISVASAASVGNVESTTEKRVIIPLLSFERENKPDGSFKFSYEGGDQTFREETANIVDAGTEDEALEVSGSYRYIDDQGNTVEVHYTAGKNGFVPVGTNILSEISAAAKAAADLPQSNEEVKRKGRSNKNKDDKEEKADSVKEQHQTEEHKKKEKKVEKEKVKEQKAEESEVIQVKIIPATEVQDESKTKDA